MFLECAGTGLGPSRPGGARDRAQVHAPSDAQTTLSPIQVALTCNFIAGTGVQVEEPAPVSCEVDFGGGMSASG